jgi:dTMP kinase
VGHFIAIEGGDGSGKRTQTKILAQSLRDTGYDVLELSFPRYGNPSAYYVEQYLNGAYGNATDVPAELGTLPYMLDRYAAAQDIIRHLKKPQSIVLSDRYMASNLAHQGTKIIGSTEERKKFYERTKLTEYDVLNIPRADINIVLLVPAETAQKNVDAKDERSYTALKRDIHESDANHLELAKANYEELCRLYPDEFRAIVCTDSSKHMRNIDDIQADIRALVAL